MCRQKNWKGNESRRKLLTLKYARDWGKVNKLELKSQRTMKGAETDGAQFTKEKMSKAEVAQGI